MISFEDIKIYLPKYLTPESEYELFSELNAFPDNIDDRLYTNFGLDKNLIYQGDGLEGLLYVSLPDKTIGEGKRAMVFSNSCDIDIHNKRFYASNIIYSPIFEFSKYSAFLKQNVNLNEAAIEDHLSMIRRQRITSIFYLPSGSGLSSESLVFFDRINTCDLKFIFENRVHSNKIFTLSQYGLYLFIIKLSIHFTRLNEHLDRNMKKNELES